eukprot:CAMPEP_0183314956 /NCGR_PEP_ID=MMETSP0160_2-20130417/50213_1 /TAXON_ID=2839 ORGANISM="Odontella Sinensis, Strain Grunow 1884" /NCGR_SAMPLE_ID=MMETSP0160_2 /ASSEMBLY_ACC=CAM_ASM_000250 /LENGTH=97 /DNA_ID=CAMNT_0025480407 /DNA_START=1 /DNA_END=291 /DNA_ORIENTATION=+
MDICRLADDGKDGGDGGDRERELHRMYRVVGNRGCQLRATEAMNSEPVACLPPGSVVTVLSSRVSPKYDLLSRRVLVRHSGEDNGTGGGRVEGSQGR